jgi:hypothetical protein
MNISNIPIENLNPAKYAMPMLKALKEYIKEFGVIDPISVNTDMTITADIIDIKPALIWI